MKILLLSVSILSLLPASAHLATDPAVPDALWTRGWWISRFEAKKAEAARCDYPVVFLGDSITHGWEGAGSSVWTNNFLSGPYRAINAGFSGDRTEHLLWRLRHGQLDGLDPKAVVLMIGTNNTGHRPLETESVLDTVLGVKAILKELEHRVPSAKVILHPIFPRGETVSDPLRLRNDHVNQALKAYVARNPQVLWCDFNARLVDAEGRLSHEMMKDLLHPGQVGYEIWARELRPYLDYALGRTETVPSAPGGAMSTSVDRTSPRAMRPEANVYWLKDGPSHSNPRMLRKREEIQSNRERSYDIVLIGDSITHFWEGKWGDPKHPWPAYASITNRFKTLNVGFGADRIENLLWNVRFGGMMDGYQAKAVMLLVGTNNIGESAPEVAEGIGAVVAAIRVRQPQAKIVVVSLLPRRATKDTPNYPFAAKHREVNTRIRKLEDGKNVFSLDLYDRFLNEDGSVNEAFYVDSAHPNGAGYDIWAKAALPLLERVTGHATVENNWVFAIQYLNSDQELDRTRDLVRRAKTLGYTGLALITGRDFTAWTEAEANDGSNAFVGRNVSLEAPWRMPLARQTRFRELAAFCRERMFDLVPLVWSVGYCSMQYVDSSLVAVWPVRDVPYVVKAGRGIFAAEAVSCDTSALDCVIDCTKKTGRARTAKFPVRPARKYRISAQVRTDGVEQAPKPGQVGPILGIVASSVKSGHYLASHTPHLQPTQDWTDVGFTLLTRDTVEDQEVTLRVSDSADEKGFTSFRNVRIEELGIEYPIRRVGTTFVVKDAETGRIFKEGIDYETVSSFDFLSFDRRDPAFELKVLSGGAITDGMRLLVSAYEPKSVYGDQHSACLSNPELLRYYRRSAAALHRMLDNRKWFLSADEFRVGCACESCRASGKTMGELFGETIRAQRDAIRAVCPDADICMWSDMIDDNHNAIENYYLLYSPNRGGLQHVPRDITVMCWWGAKASVCLPFFESHGFRTMGAGFYDAKTEAATRASASAWAEAAARRFGFRGFMYTTWDYGIGCNHAFIAPWIGELRH